MRRRHPDPYDLAVRAALRPPEEAQVAWAAWEELVHLDDVDDATFLLLPLVHANLLAAGVDPASLGRLRNVTRHAWLQRQVALDAGGELRTVLEAAGLPSLAIGGTSRLRYYGEGAARGLPDAGLLVRPGDAGAGVDAVLAAGWEHVGLPVDVARRRWATFRTARDVPVALHWRVLGPLHDGGDDRDFWDRAGAAALAPADELVHVLVHGVTAREPAPWPADAAMVIRAGVDWDGFVKVVRGRRLDPLVGKGLDVLAGPGGVAVPDEVRTALRAAPGDALRRWSRQRGARTPAELILRRLRPPS